MDHLTIRQYSAIQAVSIRFFAILTGIVCAFSALRRGIVLPPLPTYWDTLATMNWPVLTAEDGREYGPEFKTEYSKYVKVREVAHFSTKHENLLVGFLEHGEGKNMPPRPKWLS